MAHQDGFGYTVTKPAGLSKPNDDDYQMQKKFEDIAHARMASY